ncbi:MAG: Mur ligase family protein, partial [Anaerovorax sp.]
MKLSRVLQGTQVICPREAEEIEITGIAFNSEQVEHGNIFVCIKGQHDNGQLYVLDAAFKGAAVILSEEKVEAGRLPVLLTKRARETLTQISYNFYANQENKINLMGVTGTNGKTTVAYMIQCIFEFAGRPCGMIGTIQYSFANKVYKAINTTPEPCYLQRLFSEMGDCGVKDCIMEVSSHSLELGRVDHLKFQYGIFTNLTPEHMDFHKTIEQYFKAKKRLFYMTKKGNIINIDEDFGRRILKELNKINRVTSITYSLKDRRADYYCTIIETRPQGSHLYVYENQEV